MNRAHERVAAIEALPEEDRAELLGYMARGDVFNDALTNLETFVPGEVRDTESYGRQVALLKTERDNAWREAERLEAALGLPEPW